MPIERHADLGTPAGASALAVGSVYPALGRQVNGTAAITHLFVAGSGSTLPGSIASPSNGTGAAPAIYLIEI